MKLADVQILFYAIDPTAGLHAAAARWLEGAINGRETVSLGWPTLHEFLHLGTNPGFLVAISHGAMLASFDSDFGAFVAHGLRWERVAST